MKRIKEYLVDRNLETTKKILKEEMKIINNEIEKLTQNKDNIKERLNTIKKIDNNLEFNKIQVVPIKERGLLKLDIDDINEVSCIIKKLQQEYRILFYILGNNKIGVTYNTEKILESNEISYTDAFYIVKNDKPYDMQLNKNNYLYI